MLGLKDIPDVKWIFVGGGSRKDWLEKYDFFNEEYVPYMLHEIDKYNKNNEEKTNKCSQSITQN